VGMVLLVHYSTIMCISIGTATVLDVAFLCENLAREADFMKGEF
jgi:hypothetical protein